MRASGNERLRPIVITSQQYTNHVETQTALNNVLSRGFSNELPSVPIGFWKPYVLKLTRTWGNSKHSAVYQEAIRRDAGTWLKAEWEVAKDLVSNSALPPNCKLNCCLRDGKWHNSCPDRKQRIKKQIPQTSVNLFQCLSFKKKNHISGHAMIVLSLCKWQVYGIMM